MLIGKHVRLRIVDSVDADYLRQLRNSPAVASQFQSRHFINDVAQKEFIARLAGTAENLYFIAEYAVSGERFGVYFVRHVDHRNQRGENGVFLDPEVHSDGVVALEAAFLLLQYEFSYLNLQKICAVVLASNTKAIRFNEALGMKPEGLQKKHVYFDGAFHDLILFSLFREDFEQTPTPIIRSFRTKLVDT